MEKKLKTFLDNAFKPYGDFPARDDVLEELLANMVEKFDDLKKQDKSDDEAYKMTIDSFGDAAEIMDQVSHDEPSRKHEEKSEPSLYKTIVDGIKEATGNNSTVTASALMQADLTDIDLSGKDFSMSALEGTSFDRSNLRNAKFKAADLRRASFTEANLTEAVFKSSDVESVSFDKADLTDAIKIV